MYDIQSLPVTLLNLCTYERQKPKYSQTKFHPINSGGYTIRIPKYLATYNVFQPKQTTYILA